MRLVFLALLAFCAAHTPVRPEGLTWQAWHMKEEHNMDSFDALSFFALHDLQNKGYWTANDILYVYGLSREAVVGDGSGMGEHDHQETIAQLVKGEVVKAVLALLHADSQGRVAKASWVDFSNGGGVLPDFGTGPGHHMDFEAEYENHHWNKYHRDHDPDVHVKHKEDIEHELLHHAHEIEETHGQDPNARKMGQNFASPVKVHNIPKKYLAT